MSRLRLALPLMLAAASCLPLAARAQADKATIDALDGCFDFVDANAGTILPEQIPSEDYKKFYVLDVRDGGQFAKEHIPGAVNIEWRQVFAQRSKRVDRHERKHRTRIDWHEARRHEQAGTDDE